MSQSADRSSEYLRFRRLGPRVDTWALSSEADVAKEIFASIASDGARTFADLRASVDEGTIKGWDPAWVARLARVLSLQPHESEHHAFALEALKLAVPELSRIPANLPVRKILFELLLQNGELDAASDMLDEDPVLNSMYHGYYRADLLNPFRTGRWSDFDEWLSIFNAPFVDVGLSPISVEQDSPSPFNSMGSTVAPASVQGPLVTVILTTFNPDPTEIRTSVRSILEQTWANLEVLLIDDHSEQDSIAVLERLAAEDSRVKLIRQPENGGTYRARNTGILRANGVYVTGQDTDDWSHPQRIEHQVAALEANPEKPGVTTAANRTDERLNKVAVGNSPHRRCEVSLMLRTETARTIGGYLPVRKAADSEFRERLETWWGDQVVLLPEPLYMIRMSPGSLSRADFRPGWSHHARRAFWSAYKNWHATADRDDLQIDPTLRNLPVPATAPQRIAGPEWAQGDRCDVCIVADWRGESAEQRAALDELRSLLDSGLEVAILHADTPWGGHTQTPRALTAEVQQLVTDGRVRRVFTDEYVDVRLLLIRDPAAVDYARRLRSSLQADRVLLVAHSNPAERPRTLRTYDPHHAHVMARQLFGQEPSWVVPLGQDAAAFEAGFDLATISDVYPVTLDTERFSGTRLVRSGGRLVIGRDAINDVREWPDKDDLIAAYPSDGSVELRVLGDARGAVRVLGERRVSDDWLEFRNREISAGIFWRTLDGVFLYKGYESGHGFERGVLEALSAGTPVVAGTALAQPFGGAVLAAHPEDAIATLESLLSEPRRLSQQRQRGQDFVQTILAQGSFRGFVHHQLEHIDERVERHV